MPRVVWSTFHAWGTTFATFRFYWIAFTGALSYPCRVPIVGVLWADKAISTRYGVHQRAQLATPWSRLPYSLCRTTAKDRHHSACTPYPLIL
ncbi:hypothetical protein BDN67DRAFT_442657 [Paxillus ammoniavirescens]|nr:hypothetical protein BDN67DRAFT_442657 [Paxillus ammoniavirescens]